MAVKLIAILNQKGGAGKTTICMQLAGSLSGLGRVLVVDGDEQGTATRWAASASDEQPFPAAVIGLAAAGAKIHREIRKHLDAYDFILIDCPPSVSSPVPQSALLVADLALVPIVPSPADLWAATGTRELIERASIVNESLQALLVPNMVPHTKLGDEVLATFQDMEIPLSETRLRLRTVYRESAVYGDIVHNMGARGRDAAREIDALRDEVLQRLGV